MAERDPLMSFTRVVTPEVSTTVGIAGFGPTVREIAAALPVPQPPAPAKETPHP